MTEELDRLIADLDVRSGDYKRAWVDAALAQGDAIVPRLVAYLEAVVADPETFDRTRAAALGHLYALAALTHAREARAHDVVVALAGLEPDVLDRLLGDYLTEGLAGALAATSGGRLDRLTALMNAETADDFARGAAVEALALLAHTGGADRGAVLDALAGRLEREARHDYVNAVTVAALVDLHAVDRRDAIRAAFEAERVDETVAGDRDDVDARFDEGPEPGARRLDAGCARELPADPHDILRGMYDLPDLPPPHRDREEARAQSAADVARRVPPKAAAKAKAKRKAAKGARKKQRRK